MGQSAPNKDTETETPLLVSSSSVDIRIFLHAAKSLYGSLRLYKAG